MLSFQERFGAGAGCGTDAEWGKTKLVSTDLMGRALCWDERLGFSSGFARYWLWDLGTITSLL